MDEKLIARGRVSTVHELTDGRVLRRAPGSDAEREAAVMRHAASFGVPVPRVLEARGGELVMDRVEGPTLAAELLAHPDRVEELAQVLAELHAMLDEVPPAPRAPWVVAEGASSVGAASEAAGLVHLDLHPLNVICSPAGPVLLDWTDASNGPRAADRASTWLVLACHELPPEVDSIAGARESLIEAFLAAAGRERSLPGLELAAERQLSQGLGASVHARIRELLAAEGVPVPGC